MPLVVSSIRSVEHSHSWVPVSLLQLQCIACNYLLISYFVTMPVIYIRNVTIVSLSQAQISPDLESALLQQVLSLTPEQLNSLPPEQRQQVIQLQQALLRDQTQPS